MQHARPCDEVIEEASAFVGRRGPRETGPRARIGVCRQRELRHQQQSAVYVAQGKVHAAGRVGKDAEAKQFFDQCVSIELGVAAFGAYERHDAGADFAGDPRVSPNARLRNALNQRDHSGMLGSGEEFRDDLRGTAGPVNVRKVLPPDVLAELTRMDPWRSSWAIAKTFGLLALAIVIAWTNFTWWVVVPAVLLIGIQQHALFVLAHDAAHYRLFEMRWLNEFFGRLFGALGGVSVCSYRVIHRLHHNNLYGDVDPDIALHGGYPRGRAYLAWKLLQDIVGWNAWKTYKYFFGNPAVNAKTNVAQRPLDDTSDALRSAGRRDRWSVAAFHVAAPLIFLATGGVDAMLKYLVLWLLPLLTVIQPILRLRAICEHGAVTDLSTPLTAARTNLPGALARFVMFPHNVNYHVEHHLFPAVPHYHLPRLHRELVARGVLAKAEVRSVRETFGRVFAERGSASAVA